ncbi:helix-turn-helix transcriptional regulator [Arcanobacterium hippocoleae]
MTITFKPLWKLLIDRDMTREELRLATGLSPATIAKLGRDGNVTTDVLARICTTLECDINDICEAVPTEQPLPHEAAEKEA